MPHDPQNFYMLLVPAQDMCNPSYLWFFPFMIERSLVTMYTLF